MTNHRALLRAARLVNPRTLKLLAVLGTVMAVSAAVMSALGALLMVRQLQLVSAQRKALPVLQEAAELYLRKNGEEPLAKRRKAFLRPKAKEDPEDEPSV